MDLRCAGVTDRRGCAGGPEHGWLLMVTICYVFSLSLLWYSASFGLVTNNQNGDTGAYIFGCMFMVLATMFKIYRSRR